MKDLMKLKNATRLAVALTVLLVVGCSQGPDFSEPRKVIRKSTGYGATEYTLENDGGIRGAGWGAVVFNAPEQLAKVGDTIVFDDGVLTASKGN